MSRNSNFSPGINNLIRSHMYLVSKILCYYSNLRKYLAPRWSRSLVLPRAGRMLCQVSYGAMQLVGDKNYS